MAFIRRLRNQNWLFPPSIADLIEEDHICRLVDEVVEGIDLKRIEKRYDGPGSPAYHPKVMMNLETIKLAIAEIVKLAREMGMVKLGHLSTDGTKIKASASNFSLREFLTRGFGGVRAEFSLAYIAHNLKRIWKTKSQIEGIRVNSTEGGRFDHTFLKSLCLRINAFMSMSGSLGYKAIRGILNSIMGQPLHS